MNKLRSQNELEQLRKDIRGKMDQNKPRVVISTKSACCYLKGSKEVAEAFESEIGTRGLKDKVNILTTGCLGFCGIEPIVIIEPQGILYQQVKVEDVSKIISETVLKGKIIDDLLYLDPVTGKRCTYEKDIPFYKKQKRVILGDNRKLDPDSIKDYISIGGYSALTKALFEMKPEEIIDEIKASGLKGRGGAGFPTGLKWEFCKNADGEQKYIICNADEGDPGVYKDRSILEGNPHSVVEAMIIGSRAMGAQKGYIYIRHEYPFAIQSFSNAIDQAREAGLLGENILQSGHNFDIDIFQGAGSYVCGEETALMESIEGKVGKPRNRPPFPAQKGLWGCPTNINNVETLANIPHILNDGAESYSAIGTEGSKGTKIFSLVGKINNTGLVEVPMNTSLRNIVYEIGGGIPGAHTLKGVQTGSPFGGSLPPSQLDVTMAFESLEAAGTIMGSGGLVVMDEDTCMVDMAKVFINLTSRESCGNCTSCREGLHRILEILTDITEGRGKIEDLELLEELSEYIIDTSLCGLGQTAPTPVLSTLKYFRQEYEDHILHHHCSASVCTGLFNTPCQNACPAETNVPGYIQLIAEGRYFEAYDLNRDVNPLPGVCGRVCFHPCESKCKRGTTDEPLSIMRLKRTCSDYVFEHRDEYVPKIARLPDTGKRVAVVGGGPAGLSAAYFLRRLGHAVTIFEGTNKLGGMLVQAIPSYRLPRQVLDREIRDILDLGVDVRYDTMVGKDITFEQLRADHDSVFLGLGAAKDLSLGIEGEECQGVTSALKMLYKVWMGGGFKVGDRVVVVGGGNVAVDAARTARRLGASEVTIVYRREKKDMPAFAEEIQDAIDEGIKITECLAPGKAISADGKVTALECMEMELGEYDLSGRRKPVETRDCREYQLDADTVLVAIGQRPDTDWLPESLERKRNGALVGDRWDNSSSMEGVFVGGDAMLGPASVIEAIAHGKRGAGSIDAYLMGHSRMDEIKVDITYSMGVPDNSGEMARVKPDHVDPASRITGFDEVVKGYTLEQAKAECARCLRCDIKEIAPMDEEEVD